MNDEFWNEGNLMALGAREIVKRHAAEVAELKAERDAAKLQYNPDDVAFTSRVPALESEIAALRWDRNEAIATPETLEELAEIGWEANRIKFNKVSGDVRYGWSSINESERQAVVAEVAAILHAAQAYVDIKYRDMVDALNKHNTEVSNEEWEITFQNVLNSRIRYRVAVPPETPEGLPIAEELIPTIGKQLDILYDEKFSPYSERGWEYARAILTALRPWLHTPVGWELDVTAQEATTAYYDFDGGDPESMQAVLDLCRSRIWPVFECKECAGKQTRIHRLEGWVGALEGYCDDMSKLAAKLPARAALEGE